MQLKKQPLPHRRSVKRSPRPSGTIKRSPGLSGIRQPSPRYRQKRRRSGLVQQLSRLKYGNILFLLAGVIALSWLITSPFRGRGTPEPPIIPPLASTTLPIDTPTPVSEKAPPQEEGFVYNVKTPPTQIFSKDLQNLVDELVEITRQKGLPTESLSISLVDVSQPNFHSYAGYKNQVLRFPASVSKMFWMVEFYAAVEKGMIQNESDFHSNLEQMMLHSNNDAASRIVDKITGTTSGTTLEGEELKTWLEQRQTLNTFFSKAGYEGIKLSTKNYPIYTLKQEQPVGRDLQLKEVDPENGLRNQVTTDHASRLLYEIYTRQAVSPLASRKMAYLLTRDLNPKAWRNDPTNGIKGFLGESLPTNIYFGSKVGYTSKSRQEAIFVRTLDDRAIYILSIFGDDVAYAKDEEIFPKLSRYVFDHLTRRSPKN